MLQIAPQMKVLVAVEPADFRRGIDGLARLCQETLQQVQSAYPDARFDADDKGVTLHHSRPPVTKTQQAFLLE